MDYVEVLLLLLICLVLGALFFYVVFKGSDTGPVPKPKLHPAPGWTVSHRMYKAARKKQKKAQRRAWRRKRRAQMRTPK